MAYDLTLALDDNAGVLMDTPAFLDVAVGNGDVGELVTFTMLVDEVSVVLLADLELDEYGMGEFSVPIPELLTGTHELIVTGEVSTTATLEFAVDRAPLDPTEEVEDETPVLPEVDYEDYRWHLVDTVADIGWTFPANPRRWSNPERPGWFEHEGTAAPDGQILAWEAGNNSWSWDCTGYLDDEATYDALVFWGSLRRRFWLIDHRHELRYVTFDRVELTPRIVPDKPWAHDYKITVVQFYRQDLEG